MFSHNLFQKMNRLDFAAAMRVARRQLERLEKTPGHFLRTEAMEERGLPSGDRECTAQRVHGGGQRHGR